jgi:hypothetical protein
MGTNEDMMEAMMGDMSKEDMMEMMGTMIEGFLADMSAEDRQKMMEQIMPRMMEGVNMMDMMGGMMMGLMGEKGGGMMEMMSRMCGGASPQAESGATDDGASSDDSSPHSRPWRRFRAMAAPCCAGHAHHFHGAGFCGGFGGR